MDLFISFVFGTIASLLASYLYARYSSMVIQNRYKSLEGWWVEIIETSNDRSYSLAQFAFDPKTNTYSFDGTNFKNNGDVFCSWSSISVQVEQTSRRILYIFRAGITGANHLENHGFGVINFSVNKSGEPVPESGYYIEAKQDDIPHTHSIESLDSVSSRLGIVSMSGESVESFHKRIVMTLHAQRSSVTHKTC
jgi:hypothetical protein